MSLSFSSDGFSFNYDGRAERIHGDVVSPGFFSFLALKPFPREGFTRDVQAGRWTPEAVLSYRFWLRRFGGDRRVIVIHIKTYAFTIVGVSPPTFHSLVQGFDSDLRMPVMPDGTAIASAASQLLARYRFEASSVDPSTLLISATAMLVVAGIAVSIPAIRAFRIDPMAALRQE